MTTTADLVSPSRYAEVSSGGKFKRPKHIRALEKEVMATLFGDYDILVAMAPPRHGKLLADSTPVWTSQGWKEHGKLQVGDFVFSPSGKPVMVLWVGPKDQATLSVNFVDGSSIKCHENHEWLVTDRGRHRKSVKLETKQIAGSISFDESRNGSPRARYLVGYCKPLAGCNEPLPLDPYLLGVWLGDGKQSGGSLCGAVEDVAIIEAEVSRRGWIPSWSSIHAKTGVKYIGYRGLYPILRSIGLANEKFIPTQYMIASESQRRDLLSGLVDTDGSVEQGGRVRFVSSSIRLAQDVAHLVRTLGYRATITTQQPSLSTSGIQGNLPVHTVQWSPHDGIPQGRLPRKSIAATCVRRQNSIQSVTSCDPEQGNCIQVEGGLYLVGTNLITTHNSEYLSRWLPAWYMNVFAERRIIAASYSLGLARLSSRWARDQCHKDAPLFGRRGVNRIIAGATDWQTMEGGGMLAAGIGGGITGRGADMFLIDDCLKNSDQALSETIRDSQWEWWQTTAYTRLQPGGKMVVLSTRWHEDDLLGRILKFTSSETTLRVREVRFPAIAENVDVAGDPLGRAEGEALWPEQWPIEHLLRIKSAMSSYWWEALYQQRLTNHGSNEWPDSYFWGVMVEPEEWPDDLALSATALDPSKGKDAKRGDYSAIVNVGYKSGMLYVEADIDRRPVPQMIDDLVRFNMRVRPTVTGIESVAFQELLAPQYVQSQAEYNYHDDPQLIQNTVNKRIRISRLGYWLRRHKIKIKNNAAGQLLLSQLKGFPSANHDDGCFVAGTLVQTQSGMKQIQDVNRGEFVMTRHGFREVLLSSCTGIRETAEYFTNTGESIACTPTHPVYDGHSFSPIRSVEGLYRCQGFTQQELLQPSGIVPMLEGSGIVSTENVLQQQYSQLTLAANTVEKRTRQKRRTAQCSVRQDAGSESMPLSIERIISSNPSGKKPVYNLTVDGGEYLANGFVVHNCDAMEMAMRLLLEVCDQLQEIANEANLAGPQCYELA